MTGGRLLILNACILELLISTEESAKINLNIIVPIPEGDYTKVTGRNTKIFGHIRRASGSIFRNGHYHEAFDEAVHLDCCDSVCTKGLRLSHGDTVPYWDLV